MKRLGLSLLLIFGCSGPQQGAKRDTNEFDRDRDAGRDDASVDAGPPDGGDRGCAALGCDPHASCDDSSGTPRCVCFDGYTGDGQTCTNVDECQDGPTDCDARAHCFDVAGGYVCICDQDNGYTGDGMTCTGTDECMDSELNTCDPNAACSDLEDGFSCACEASVEGDGFGCADIDECADADLYECAANASCRNTFGGYACDCNPGFTGDGNASCTGLCEATPCPGNAYCRVLDDAPDCSTTLCAPGFIHNGASCVAVSTDTCAACDGLGGDDDPGAVCTGTAGAGTCTCGSASDSGYTGTVGSCADVDECLVANGGCLPNEICVNLPGGFVCSCQPGQEKDGAGHCVVDADECLNGTHTCHPNAECSNTAGSYTCACNDGFSGDGSVCRDIDECMAGEDNCLTDGTAFCVNTNGSFDCRCKRGYTGDGVTGCENLDECAMAGLNDCDDDNATCTDTTPEADPIGYECTCNSGLEGDGRTCADRNECNNAALNDCDENATCINTPGSYECVCQAPLIGDDPENCYCDLTGYWAMRSDVEVCWCERDLLDVPIISAGSLRLHVWELHRYSYDGETVTVEKKGCGGDDTPDLISPFFSGETYASFEPDQVYFDFPLSPGVDIPEAGIVPGSRFTTPDEAAIVGIELEDPLGPWPVDSDAVNDPGGGLPEWSDDDGDGQPGWTLWPRPPSEQTADSTAAERDYYEYPPIDFDNNTSMVTRRAGCVSSATRVITHLDVDVRSCDRMIGEVTNVRTEGRVQACTEVPMAQWDDDITCTAEDWQTMMLCDNESVLALDEQDQSQQNSATFELIKIGDLDDDIDCLDVRELLPARDMMGPSIRCDCP